MTEQELIEVAGAYPQKTVVQVEYWLCGHVGHRHLSCAIAQACIVKHSKKQKSEFKTKQLERMMSVDNKLLSFHLAGVSSKDLAAVYDVSVSRIRARIRRARDRLHEGSIKQVIG